MGFQIPPWKAVVLEGKFAHLSNVIARRCGLMSNYFDHLFWLPCIADADILFYRYLTAFFFFLSFFSLPVLSGHKLDVCSTSTHDVVLVRI